MAKRKVVDEESNDDFKIAFEEPQQPTTVEEALDEQNLAYGSDAWQEMLMSELTEEEKYEERYPRCIGLRRLAQKYLGDFKFAGPVNFDVSPTEDSRVVTVLYELQIYWKMSLPIDYGNIDVSYPVRTFRGLADCVETKNNKFAQHPAATAETKAESRALKKALGLQVTSAEEMVSGYTEDAFEPAPSADVQKITERVKNLIHKKLVALGISLEECLREFKGPANLDDFSLEQGHAFFNYIQKHQQKN